jgi:uncharacterized protein (DUF305 family)
VALATDPTVDQPIPPDDGYSDDDGNPWWHSPWRLLVLGVALIFLGAAIGYVAFGRTSVPSESSVDVGFLQDMRYHHDQAVSMALLMRQKPAADQDPTLRAIAGEILLGQQLENGSMVQILADWGRPEANESGTGMAWMGLAVPIDRMPGMASADEMQQLAQAQGHDADVRFAKLMVAHHQGGIHMAEYAAQHAKDSRVRTLAAAMASSQTSEIGELNQALTRLGA